MVEHLPKSLLLCREARALTLDLMPVDILDFLELWPLLKHHSLLVVLAGIMEEPITTSAWRGTPLLKALAAAQGKSGSKVQIDAEIVYSSLEQVVQVLDSTTWQARDNSDCAVSRFMSTMRRFGIAVPDKSKKKDCMTRDTRVLASLLVAADSLQSLWVDVLISEDVEIISDRIGAFVSALGIACPDTLPTVCHLCRKVILARLVEVPVQRCRDWSTVPASELRKFDDTDVLKSFPPKYSSADISRTLFDRDDWGIFATIFGCLWGEVADSWPVEDVIGVIRNGSAGAAAKNLALSTGMSQCPLSVIKSLIPQTHSTRTRKRQATQSTHAKKAKGRG